MAVAHALRARGHEIGFYSGAAVQSIVQGEGFRFFPFKNVDEDRITALASSEFPYSPSLLHRLRTARLLQTKFREWLLDTIPQQVDDLDQVMSHWRPDVLICDLAFWGPILVLKEARHIPVAVLSILAACILPGPDVPFWGQGSPRPRNAIMRSRAGLQRTLLDWLSAGFRSQVNAMRRRYGLPGLRCSD
jgi:hypothetical protein